MSNEHKGDRPEGVAADAEPETAVRVRQGPMTELPSIVPRSPQEGLESALNALTPSVSPTPQTDAAPPPAGSQPLVDIQGPARPAQDGSSAVPAGPAEDEAAAAVPESTRPGLLSAVLSRPEAPHDHGAQAAYRSIPRRSSAALRPALVGPDREAERERAGLLEHLAERAQGKTRAQLITAAAEQWQRVGEPARHQTLYARAQREDPEDLVVLRELRKLALTERDLGRARELCAREAKLPLTKEERALGLLLEAELELRERGDHDAARRAAEQSFELHKSVAAGVLLCELHMLAGQRARASEALQNVAAHWPDDKARGAALLEAGRLLLDAGDASQAQGIFERAHGFCPQLLDAALCWYRAARRAGDQRAALVALEQLDEGLGEGGVAEHLRRGRARLLEAHGNTAEALRLLASAESKVGLRLRARLAEKLGDRVQQRAGLEAYARVAGGSERALGLLGLVELDAAAGDFEGAARTLRQAAAADGRLSLVRTTQTALARASGDATSLASAPADAGVEETLEAAARAAADPHGARRELALLAATESVSLSAAQLAIDAAAELESWSQVATRLAHEAEVVAPAQRLGVELALCDVREDHDLGESAEPSSKDASAHGPLLALLRRIHSKKEPQALGTLWLELSTHLRGEAAASAATLAGDYLSEVGGGREAYERALAAAPGYAPACWALEPMLQTPDDLPALVRVHASLARASEDPLERAARSIRMAWLLAKAGKPDATSRMREAAALAPTEALLWDRMRSDGDEASALALAEILEDGGHSASGPLASLAKLRAAAFYEDADEPARAAVLYREVLDQSQGQDPHAAFGLERTLAQAGLVSLLVERLEREVQRSTDASVRGELLERLALVHAGLGDERRAAQSWHALLELDGEHVGALRAVQRHAMERRDQEQLAFSAERLGRRLSDPRERAAQLRLHARARDLQGRTPALLGDTELSLGLWHALAAERGARARSDALGTASALLRLCTHHIGDAGERASYAMWAAEALERISAARAAEALQPFAEAVPSHTLAHEALGRLRQGAGDAASAARAYEQAALASPSRLRSARQWYRAAVLWQEVVGDDARARRALESVAAIDVLHRDVFQRLRRLLTAAEDWVALAALLQTRVLAGGEPRLLSDFHVERSRLLMNLGQREQAKAALRAALELDPERVEALRAVAELHLHGAEFREAAEALIRVARLSQEQAVLRDAFMTLGRIYTEQLPDLRRAEIAYGRAVGLDPNDAFALERLLHVFRRKRDHDKALLACDRLLDLARDDAELDRRTVELASVLEDKGERLRAERALNDRREQRPGSAVLITALCDLYARGHDQPALSVHLQRSIHALRAAILEDPQEPLRWSALCDVLARRGRTHAAQCVAALASDLGLADAHGEQLAAHYRPLGGEAFAPAIAQRLWPEALSQPACSLLAWLEPKLGQLMPYSGRSERIEQLPAALKRALEKARTCVEIPNLVVCAIEGSELLPLHSKPPTLLVGRVLIADCDADELAFLLLRAAAVARFSLSAAVRSDPSELAELLASAVPTDAQSPRPESKLSARQSRDLHALVKAASSAHPLDTAELRELALQAGARLALTALGKLGTALAALASCEPAGLPTDYEGHDLVSALARSAEARALLHFALSDAHIDLRSQLEPESKAGEP